MCIRVRNVSPKCSTWLHLGSWGWGRLHSNVGHPKSKRENANLVDRNHISTHRFSGQKMGGEALVPLTPHFLPFSARFGESERFSPSCSALSLAGAALAAVRNACVVASGFLENCSDKPCTLCRGRAFERSPFATASRLLRTVASSTRPQATVPPPRDATVSGVQRGALKWSAGGVGERKSSLSVRCVHSGVLGRSECRWHRQGGAVVVDGRPPPPSWRPSSSRDGRPF